MNAKNNASTAILRSALTNYINATKNMNANKIRAALNNKRIGLTESYKNRIANAVANAVIKARKATKRNLNANRALNAGRNGGPKYANFFKLVNTKKVGGNNQRPANQRPANQRPANQRPANQRPANQRQAPGLVLKSNKGQVGGVARNVYYVNGSPNRYIKNTNGKYIKLSNGNVNLGTWPAPNANARKVNFDPENGFIQTNTKN
jgi:hypothetical protein